MWLPADINYVIGSFRPYHDIHLKICQEIIVEVIFRKFRSLYKKLEPLGIVVMYFTWYENGRYGRVPVDDSAHYIQQLILNEQTRLFGIDIVVRAHSKEVKKYLTDEHYLQPNRHIYIIDIGYLHRCFQIRIV